MSLCESSADNVADISADEVAEIVRLLSVYDVIRAITRHAARPSAIVLPEILYLIETS